MLFDFQLIKTRLLYPLCVLALLSLSGTAVFIHPAAAQTISIGSIQDEQMMIHSLLDDSLRISTIKRPFSFNQYRSLISTQADHSKWWNRDLSPSGFVIGDFFTAGLMPVSAQTTFNSRFPHGENNEAAWYGRGFNHELSAGFYLRSNYLTLTIQPHFIYQENIDFLTPRFVLQDPVNGIYGTETFTELIDYPFRFGNTSFTTIDAGYSSIRLHAYQLEMGVGTDPQWWGSTIRYPLMMSNNAPGFQHFFLGTRDSLTIPGVGDIRFRWMMGYPSESGYFSGVGQGFRRFFNGINVSFTPRVFKNFTLGITRVYHFFETDGFKIENMFVLFNPFTRSGLVQQQGEDEFRQARNQIASLYFQLKMPDARGEIYGEFYREDHSFDLRDLFVQPHHNSAYALGFRKLSTLPWFDFVITNLEFTNLTTSQLQQVRQQANYYTHTPIGQGHTHRGHILGAAIGPGSSSQLVSMNFYKNSTTIGLFLQRHSINDNFHFDVGSYKYSPFRRVGDFINHRINLNSGLNLIHTAGKVSVNGKLTWTKAFNYGRFETATYLTPNIFEWEHFDRVNVQFQIGITYTP